ncbi:DUF4388 domain-containing protein [Chondromyces apiculatus]|uniref:PatA-like N-terminal domain-containing protein n=1 Tax=Chondromyces apiculatus DSM 436 TaxID=1192034 RepID=A0A017TGY0_9BACT|nr:DUF4388 domain-containing protein [Chondromyces apiculatus]EYF07881.1 Hypothetical protein CAP_6903 [Chondromyces apiculatus DSM 436]
MSAELQDLVRIDATGTAHPVGKNASRWLRARRGAFRLLPAPQHVVFMRFVGEDGQRDAEDGAVVRLAGEITKPGALCDIISLVGQAGWEGELVALDLTSSRSLFFKAGTVVGARSSVETDRIGEVLYRYGALGREQIDATLAALGPDQRFGEVAVRLGFLDRARLYQLLARQAEEIAHHVMLAGDGVFYFLERFDEEQIASRQNLTVSGLLMEAVRRMDEARYFRERIPSSMHVPERLPGRAPPTNELRKMWDAIDGHLPIAELARATGQGEFDATRAVFQLIQAGLVAVHAPRPTGPTAIVTLFNDAVRAILAEVDEAGHGDEVRWQLAAFSSGAGVYDALFRRAGPSEEGTVLPEPTIANAIVLAGPEQAETMLAQWLYEYASFAMFVAEPLLRLGADGLTQRRSELPPVEHSGVPSIGRDAPLSRRVGPLIGQLAPK